MPTTVILARSMSDRSYVRARLEVRLPGDSRGLSPAFSLTGEIYEPHGTWSGLARFKNGRDYGGCCHDIIVRAFPRLRRFAEMHLSDPISGEPMHGAANGWYFYAGSRVDLRARERYTGFDRIYAHQLAERGLSDDDAGREEYCYQTACKILRVDSIPRELDHASFLRFVDDQREGWRYDAMEARALVERLAVEQKATR